MRRCVFATANDEYVPKAVVSVLSFQRHNPDADGFILISAISAENRQLCNRLRIRPIELDLRDDFHTEWEYPRECFYHFRGPDVFAERGYDVSIYVDGDTYCNGALPMEPQLTVDIAGVSYDRIGAFFTEIGDLDRIISHLNVRDVTGFERPRLQTGVLVYHNHALRSLDFFASARDLYNLSIEAGIPRKGDDSLLALLLALRPDLTATTLPRAFNLIDFKIHDPEEPPDSTITDGRIYHFVNQKPWFANRAHASYTDKYFAEKWLETMINAFSDEEVARCFPHFFKSDIPTPDDIGFYWFTPQPNFGDWITPYIVERETGSSLRTPTDPLHEPDKPVVLGVGSIMRLSGRNTVVWGSGIRDRYQDIRPSKLVRSTRGPLTRQRILEVGGEAPPIYGDPALLLPRFYTPTASEHTYRLGLLPHVSQYERVRDLYEAEPAVTVIDLRTKAVERIVDQITSCGAVASSSLHGIIVANAYSVPVRWIQFDTNIFGDNTKYYDHFRSINRPAETFIDALGYRKLAPEAILEQIYPYELEIDLDRLWEASIFDDGQISRYVRYVLGDA